MGRVEKLDSFDKVLGLLGELQYNFGINRYRSRYLYRGLPNRDFHLETSLSRNCKGMFSELESTLLDTFTKYAVTADPLLENNAWRQLIVGQHHGLPTRLLDWTHSAIIALHFATDENKDTLDKNDAVVWRIDFGEIHERLPESWRKKLEKSGTGHFTVKTMSEMSGYLVENQSRIIDTMAVLKEYDDEMEKSKSLVIMEPPSIDPRIENQYSFFSIIPSWLGKPSEKGKESIIESYFMEFPSTVKYIIKKELKWRLRDTLDQMNINERIIYPGLDGLSKLLARHYFVK